VQGRIPNMQGNFSNVEVQTGSKTSSQQKNKNERLEPMGLPCNYFESSSFPKM